LIIPSIQEIWDRVSELIENPVHKDILSSALQALFKFANESQKKSISSGTKSAINSIYNLLK
jgi:hypothetical protein